MTLANGGYFFFFKTNTFVLWTYKTVLLYIIIISILSLKIIVKKAPARVNSRVVQNAMTCLGLIFTPCAHGTRVFYYYNFFLKRRNDSFFIIIIY